MANNDAEQGAKEMAEICLRILFPQIQDHSGGAANYLKDKLMSEWRKQHAALWEPARITQ